jgi:hypothetical protein
MRPRAKAVNGARMQGKSTLLPGEVCVVSLKGLRDPRGPLIAAQKSAEAEVVDGVTTIRGEQGKLLTGRRAERQAGRVL